jgi:hypothetical protein
MKKIIINKGNIIGVLLAFLTVLSSCSRVSTNMDKSVNVSAFKSYSWKEPDIKVDNPVYKSDLIDQAIKQNVEKELAQKGLIHNDQNPDLYIVYHTYVQNVQRTYGNYGYYGGYPYGFYGSPYGWNSFGSYGYTGFGGGYLPGSYTVAEETLVLDFIDSHTNKLVWRGSTMDDVTNVSKIEKTLQKDVHSIMKKYPGSFGGSVKRNG